MAAGKWRKESEEKIIRAVTLSNLMNIYLDYRSNEYAHLSPECYCGGVAPAAAACGVAYLRGDSAQVLNDIVRTGLGNQAGIICDGAKPSCAAKIASSVEAGILGYHMYQNGQQFRGGDGIVSKGVENTIRNIGMLGHDGMRETDKEIVKIMMQKP